MRSVWVSLPAVVVAGGLLLGCGKKNDAGGDKPAPAAAGTASPAEPAKQPEAAKPAAGARTATDGKPAEAKPPAPKDVAPKDMAPKDVAPSAGSEKPTAEKPPAEKAADDVPPSAGAAKDEPTEAKALDPGDPAAVRGTVAALLGATPPSGGAFAGTETALRLVAQGIKEAKRPPAEATQAAAYRTLLEKRTGAFETDDGKQALLAAAKMTTSDDAYERGAAYQFLSAGLMELQRARQDTTPWLKVFGERLADASNKERFDIVVLLANHQTTYVGQLLLWVADNDKTPRVQAQALSSLDRCDTRVCVVPLDRIDGWLAAEQEPAVRGAAVRLAGTHRLPKVFEVCEGKLGDADLGPGCRVAMLRFRDKAAFDALYGWLDTFKDDPRSRASQERPFGHYVALLGGFVIHDFAREPYAKLIDQVLGQTDRRPETVASLADQLMGLPDKKAARTIASRHLKRYQRAWKKPNKDQRAALERLERTVKRLQR